MIDPAPPLPSGDSAFYQWARWAQRSIERLRTSDTPAAATNRTSRGVSVVPKKQSGGGASPGLDWQGEWDSAKAYKKLAVVMVTTIPSGLIGDGKNYTGTWLCVKGGTGQRPVWPLPTATDSLYWVMLGMGVREINVASDNIGAKKMLASCNDPY